LLQAATQLVLPLMSSIAPAKFSSTPVIVGGLLVDSATVPLVSLNTSLISTIIPKAASYIPQTILGLPIAGLKKKQEKYGVALRVQCVTLLDAGIPLDIICS
jgi:hypothetical protein